ncbi:hypothetical protein [Streptomyces sp. NPDC088816]|uniref:hypothetical protein n=1 Tax=Streptomyces sp. NPDC088816 TaxID=3365906 RepID=UPI00382F9270
MDTLILDLLDPEEARRPPMAMKDYSDEFKADAVALYESTLAFCPAKLSDEFPCGSGAAAPDFGTRAEVTGSAEWSGEEDCIFPRITTSDAPDTETSLVALNRLDRLGLVTGVGPSFKLTVRLSFTVDRTEFDPADGARVRVNDVHSLPCAVNHP